MQIMKCKQIINTQNGAGCAVTFDGWCNDLSDTSQGKVLLCKEMNGTTLIL